jgi:hypothetical protein
MLTAEEMQAGQHIEILKPLLPEATTTAMPDDHRLSIAAFADGD